MALPRGPSAASAPPTPHGSRDRWTSFTPARRQLDAGSEYSLSPGSTTSSVSRVDLAVSRINSLSDAEDFGPRMPRVSATSASLNSSTASRSLASSTASSRPSASLNSSARPILRPNSSLRSSTASGTSGASCTPTANRNMPPPELPLSRPSSPLTPFKPGHRITRSLGTFADSPGERPGSPFSPVSPSAVRKPTLPSNPATWTPSELAQHLAYTLRTGGPEGEEPTLPPPVIEDVISWVLRSRITGAQFLRGMDPHRGGRPPPFLPVLSALSRRMRRTIRHRRNSSAFSEADVFGVDSDDSEGVTRVKRLAHAFDAISSCSESDAGDSSLSALRAQITGDSITGYGRVTPRSENRKWTRRDSCMSMQSGVSGAESAISGISAASAPLWRMRTNDGEAASAAAADAVASWAQQCIPLELESPTVARRAEPMTEDKAESDAASAGSPPPPYHTDGPDEPDAEPDAVPNPASLLFPPTVPATPDGSRPESRSASLTPLQNDAEVKAHLLRMVAHKSAGVDPYRVLRRGSGRPASVAIDDEASPFAAVTRRTSRRASNQPHASQSPRNRDVSREVAALTQRIRELEERLVAVEVPDDDECATCPTCSRPASRASFRLNDSTSRLSSSTSSRGSKLGNSTSKLGASTSSKLNTSTSSLNASKLNASTASRNSSRLSASTLSALATERELSPEREPDEEQLTDADKQLVPYTPPMPHLSWLTLLGLVDETGSEPRYRDLPVYLFLMGVGVGVGFSAVVVKVVMSKRPA